MTQYVAEIRLFAGNFAPEGWEFCNGQLLSISEWEVVFVLIGTTYGGDGVTNFALPNLQSRVPVHQGTAATGTPYTLGETGGVENVTLEVAQIPGHAHVANAIPSAATAPGPSGNLPAAGAGITLYSGQTPNSAMNPGAIAAAGGSEPHPNIQPYQALNFIIAMEGIFPSQN